MKTSGWVVHKFGGTSVADPEKILAAARKAIRAQQEGNQVVVVVSAMPIASGDNPCAARYAGIVVAVKPHGIPCAT